MFLTEPQAGDTIASQGLESFRPNVRPFYSPAYGDGWQPRGNFTDRFQSAREGENPQYYGGGGSVQTPYYIGGGSFQAGTWPEFGDMSPNFPGLNFELPQPFEQGSFSGGTTIFSGEAQNNSICVFTDRWSGIDGQDVCGAPTGTQDSANLDLLKEDSGDTFELVGNLRVEGGEIKYRKITGLRLRLRRVTADVGQDRNHDLYLELHSTGVDETLPTTPCMKP